MIRNAAPLPPLPPDIPGDSIVIDIHLPLHPV